MARLRILGMIMAGGKGDRLFPLTKARSKPAVPFAGKHRIIDFVLSNFINSGVYAVYLLVQYKSQSPTLGASGARIAGTAALELKRRGARRALITLCVGVGQGVAMAIEN